MTENDLAVRIGVSTMTLHLYESGVVLPAEQLASIAEATGKPVGWLAGEEEEVLPSPAIDSQAEAPPEPAPEPLPDEPAVVQEIVAPVSPEPSRPVEEAETALSVRETELEQREAIFVERERQLAELAADLEGRETKLEQREGELGGRERELTELAADLEGRETKLEQREGDLGGRERQLAELAADLERRETKLAEGEIALERRLTESSEQALRREEAAAVGTLPIPVPEIESPQWVVRTGGRLAATLRLPMPTTIWRIQQIGGANVLVDTVDGRSLRVSARRDVASGAFSVSYETVGWQDWQGRRISVWEPTSAYPSFTRKLLEDCLEAALAAIDAGEHSPLHQVMVEDDILSEPEQETAPPRRKRRFLRLLRR